MGAEAGILGEKMWTWRSGRLNYTEKARVNTEAFYLQNKRMIATANTIHIKMYSLRLIFIRYNIFTSGLLKLDSI